MQKFKMFILLFLGAGIGVSVNVQGAAAHDDYVATLKNELIGKVQDPAAIYRDFIKYAFDRVTHDYDDPKIKSEDFLWFLDQVQNYDLPPKSANYRGTKEAISGAYLTYLLNQFRKKVSKEEREAILGDFFSYVNKYRDVFNADNYTSRDVARSLLIEALPESTSIANLNALRQLNNLPALNLATEKDWDSRLRGAGRGNEDKR